MTLEQQKGYATVQLLNSKLCGVFVFNSYSKCQRGQGGVLVEVTRKDVENISKQMQENMSNM